MDLNTTKLVITACGGRIESVTGRARMECLDAPLCDARIGKSFRVGRGPKLSAKGYFSTIFKAIAGSRRIRGSALRA